MSQSPPPSDSVGDLQFTTVEPIEAEPAGAVTVPACALCRQPIASSYFAIADKLLCASCRQLVSGGPPGSGFVRLLKAGVLGLGAGLVGALIWFAIRRVMNMEIGLVAIAVGFMVGKAVRKGSANRGGPAYQLIAVILTYGCIAANYVPDIIESAMRQLDKRHTASLTQHDPHGQTKPGVGPSTRATAAPPRSLGKFVRAWAKLLGLAFLLSLKVPFMHPDRNIIGLLIIGFAVWEAWKLNVRRPLPITGPYDMGKSHVGRAPAAEIP